MAKQIRPSPPRLKGMRKRLPILKVGWRDAKQLIDSGEFEVLKYDSGHAELVNRHGYAVYYLERRSVRRLEALHAD
jgi:hypothetical protein